MGVYVEIKLPKGCTECPFCCGCQSPIFKEYGNHLYCPYLDEILQNGKYDTRRHLDCPLKKEK